MEWLDRTLDNGVTVKVDSVGNILQESGAVKSIACQKCKTKFDYSSKPVNIEQNVPFYKCSDCDFGNPGGDLALDHKINNPTHNVTKTHKTRIVGVERKIFGKVAQIQKLDNDVSILCEDCS